MRYAFVLRTAIAVLTLLAGTAGAQVINVTPRSLDFGSMKQRQVKKATVVVSNDGGGLLKIEDVTADCGCTVPTLTVRELAPGESTEILIQFDSKIFEGKVHKYVKILSNDPASRETDVMITADVHAPLSIDPPSRRLGFSRSLAGVVMTRRVTFKASEVDKLELTIDKVRTDKFEARIVENIDGDPRVAALEVTVPASMPAGHHRDNIRVKTNIEDVPVVNIEAKAWVVDQLQVTPEQVKFLFQKTFNQSIRISPFEKGIEFKVTGAEVDLPGVTVEVVETLPNRETRVNLSGAPIAKDDPRAIKTKGRMLGTLKIMTDLEKTPVIEVPVSYMIRM